MPPARSGCPLSRHAQFPHMKPLSIQLHKTHGAELSAFIWLWCMAASAGEQGARRQQECQQCLLCASGAPPQVGRHPTRMLQPNQSQQRSHVLWQHMGAPRVSPPHGQGAHALLHQSFWHITSASTRPSDNLHLSHVTLHQGSLATCFKHIIHHKKSLLYLNLHPFHHPELHLHVI